MTKSTNYKEYINSVEWDEKRSLRFRMDGFRCHRCGSPYNLQCHHITYERLGHERLSDLITLCADCHKQLHGSKPKLQSEEERRDQSAKLLGINNDLYNIFKFYVSKLERALFYKLFEEFDDSILEKMSWDDLKILRATLIEMEPKMKEVLSVSTDEF